MNHIGRRLGTLRSRILSARKSHGKRKPYEAEAKLIRTEMLKREIAAREPDLFGSAR